MERGLAACASLGITSFHNMDGNRYQLELLEEIDRTAALPVRARIPFRFLPDMEPEALEVAVAMRERWSSDRLKADFVKIFMDGVIEFDDRLRARGLLRHAGAARLGLLQRRGICCGRPWQPTAWASRSPSTRSATPRFAARSNGYEAARRRNGSRDSRHRVEHIEMLDPADLPRFAELGVIASMQPTHAPGGAYPMEPIASLIGHQRLVTAYAWQTLRQSGARMAFSGDWPVASLDPLLGIATAVSRQPMVDGGPNQRQSLADALAGFTVDGAYAAFEEARKGVLKPGAMGDVAVLSGDIEAVPGAEIAALKVAATLCEGRVTYRRAAP